MLKLGSQDISEVLREWVCIITQDSGLNLLGRDDRLSSTGVTFVHSLWFHLERLRPSKKLGLWCALRSGAGHGVELKLEDVCVRPAERLTVRPNTILVLTDDAPAYPTRNRGEDAGIAMGINLSPAAINDLKKAEQGGPLDPQKLTGTIDVLTGDNLTRIGQFDDSILLLLSLERLADGIEQLRTAGTNIKIVLPGNTPPVHLVRSLKDMSHVHVDCGGACTAAVTTHALDDATRDAASEFVAAVAGAVPPSHWPEQARKIFDRLTIIWPELEALRSGRQ
ncbi:hypothetical protein ACMHYB_53555 [Sorangium sp. So ce1128]